MSAAVGVLGFAMAWLMASASPVTAASLSASDELLSPVGSSGVLQLSLDDDSGVQALAVDLVFDPAVMSITGVATTSLTVGCLVDFVDEGGGRVAIGLACGNPIEQPGVIVDVVVNGVARGSTDVALDSCMLNEGDPACTPVSGSVVVDDVTPTPTATPTQTPLPSASSTPTASGTATPTDTPSQTPTVTPTATPSGTPTWTRTPTVTSTHTPTFTLTRTPTLTSTPTQTATRTDTGTPTATATPTFGNVALGGAATQSSTVVGGVAARAIDGNTDGNWSAGSVTHTGADNPSWWEVDLGETMEIESVAVWNRTDCCGTRLSNYYVLVGNNPNPRPGSAVFQQLEAAPAGAPTVIAVGRVGRYVRIEKQSGVVSLAEVQVMGRPAPPPTQFNLAPQGTATQSSTVAGGVAMRAIDGNRNGVYGAGSVTHTDVGTPAWWELDLGAIRQIDRIDVWNRTDCCSNRLSNYYVLVANAPGAEPGTALSFQQLESATAGSPTSIEVGAAGRYVRIVKVGTGVVSLAEVEVWGSDAPPPPPANVAAGRSATQSSTVAGGVASRAVDGNPNGQWSSGSVTHTNYEASPWWEVDLGGVRSIDTVEIFNRTDCCGDRLRDYYVLVADAPNPQPGGAGVLEHFETAQAGSPTVIAVGASGRYVRVQRRDPGVVSLAEVRVWGW